MKRREDSSWAAHIADFDCAKDLSGSVNQSMNEEEFFETKSDRYSLVQLILFTLIQNTGIHFSTLEIEDLDKAITDCKFRIGKKKEALFQKLGMDPALEDRDLLVIAQERPQDQNLEIKRLIASLCFSDQVLGLFEKAHRSALKMEEHEKKYLRQGMTFQEAQQRSLIDTGFPSFEEIETVLSSSESIAQDYDF